MYKHILIATDGSEPAEKAVTHALALARQLKTRVTAVMVTPPSTLLTPLGQDLEKAATARARGILSAVRGAARKAKVPCTTLHVPDQFPAEGILQTAKSGACDLIVMAAHGGHGLSDRLIGSQATKVLTESTIPVLVCR